MRHRQKQAKIRGRHRRGHPDHEVVGREDWRASRAPSRSSDRGSVDSVERPDSVHSRLDGPERARAVLPRALEPELEPAVGEPLEALVRDRRARDVTAQPLELSAVAAVDELPSVHVDAAHLGDGLISERAGVGAARRRLGRQDEPERGQARSVAAHGDALRGCGVASGEPGLIERQLRRRSVVLCRPEAAPSRSEDFSMSAAVRRATSSMSARVGVNSDFVRARARAEC